MFLDPFRVCVSTPADVSDQLVREGGHVHAGESISYVLTKERRGESDTRAKPVGLIRKDLDVDTAKYVSLLVDSARNLLEPAGLNEDSIWSAIA